MYYSILCMFNNIVCQIKIQACYGYLGQCILLMQYLYCVIYESVKFMLTTYKASTGILFTLFNVLMRMSINGFALVLIRTNK